MERSPELGSCGFQTPVPGAGPRPTPMEMQANGVWSRLVKATILCGSSRDEVESMPHPWNPGWPCDWFDQWNAADVTLCPFLP